MSTFVRIEGAWWIVLADTKSGRPDHRPVPTFLTGFVDRYLDVYRPIPLGYSTSHEARSERCKKSIRAAETTSALWIGRFGAPLSYGAVERAVTETTRMTLNVPVNPHRFRTAVATSAALHAPQSPYLGSALLQHSDRRTTEEHYNRASSLSVARDFAKLVRKL